MWTIENPTNRIIDFAEMQPGIMLRWHVTVVILIELDGEHKDATRSVQ